MKDFLVKDSSGNWNTIPAVPANAMHSVNCHKFMLYTIGTISYEELISDPKEKRPDDFTYDKKSLEISSKEFSPVMDLNELTKLADRSCDKDGVSVGQIKDSVTGEMAHSFILKKTPDGKYMCYEKTGFKQYPFAVKELSEILNFVNNKGEKSHLHQNWRFIPLKDLKA